jgi:hypothetical protein
MKVFISSLIRGLEPLRDAAAAGIRTLGHEPLRAEDFGASPDSPQQACMAGVRDADAVVLILGDRYGAEQAGGLSATHEEYREVRDHRPVLVFIREAAEPEPKQAEFIREVQGWEQGHFTASFAGPEDLRERVTRALHDYVLANESRPLDEGELVRAAHGLLPDRPASRGPVLALAVAGGPLRAALRPAELEAEDLRAFLLATSLTGPNAVLTPAQGTDVAVRQDVIQLTQADGASAVILNEAGHLLVTQSIRRDDDWRVGIPALIEEDVAERLTRAIRFAVEVLDHVDSLQRLSHVAVVAALDGAGYAPWRTREEHAISPNAATMSMGREERAVVGLVPPVRRRAALAHDTHRIVEDLLVRLRREVTQP